MLAAGAVACSSSGSGDAAATPTSPPPITLSRSTPTHDLTATVSAGEGTLAVTAAGSAVDWGTTGHESADLTVAVDGRHVADLLVLSASPLTRQVMLGELTAGQHQIQLGFGSASRPETKGITVTATQVRVVTPNDPGHTIARNAPVLYGRSLGKPGDGLQNTWTDTPLVAWHETRAMPDGHQLLEYSIVWSNEDGGTNTPALLAQWGRTTDIEWIYRVQVAADGTRIPGTGVYQAAGHGTVAFSGTYDGSHPLLQTCTVNNNVCPNSGSSPLRFFPSFAATRDAGRAREELMDNNPWTYRIMYLEARREGKFAAKAQTAGLSVSDERNYLFLETDKVTTPPNVDNPVHFLGTSYGVTLRGSGTVYWSDDGLALISIQRDLPATTAIKLPSGHQPSDVTAIYAKRVPVGSPTPTGSVTVTRIERAFMLDGQALPLPTAIRWSGSVALTAAHPTAQLWKR
jgi:hypothetical protein